MKKKIVALCGFMGCGKTTVGKELADILNYNFIDCDAFIEADLGKSINEIFETEGEEFFRIAETNALKVLTEKENTVISLGGGAVMRSENVKILKNTVLFFLDTPFSLITERLKSDSTRPLARNSDTLSELYTKRYPFYKSAANFVITADTNPKTTAKEVAKIYGGFYE